MACCAWSGPRCRQAGHGMHFLSSVVEFSTNPPVKSSLSSLVLNLELALVVALPYGPDMELRA